MVKGAKSRSGQPTLRVADREIGDIDLRGGIRYDILGGPPDWDMWQSLPTAMLWEAVSLSLDIGPIAVEQVVQLPEHAPEYLKRLRIAESHLAAGTVLRLVSGALGTPGATVSLPEFGAWARSVGWELPAEFPRAAQDSATALTTATPQARGQQTQEAATPRPVLRQLAQAGGQTHKIGRGGLGTVLATAQRAAAALPGFQSGDVDQVLTQLQALARLAAPPHPLAGVAPDGVLYHRGTGQATFTRKNLADRMRRAKARNGA